MPDAPAINHVFEVTAAIPISICYIRSIPRIQDNFVTAAIPISICYIIDPHQRRAFPVTAAIPISICYIPGPEVVSI